MTDLHKAGTFRLGDRDVSRLGYGAMQLAGPGVFGPPKDRDAALAVLREAVASGVDHIDTSDFYGPHVTNQIIRTALHPYPDGPDDRHQGGSRCAATTSPGTPGQSRRPSSFEAVHDNLRNLGLDALDVVNLSPHRVGASTAPRKGRSAGQSRGRSLADLQATRADPSDRPEQRHGRPGGTRRRRSPTSSACRTSIISPTARTMR